MSKDKNTDEIRTDKFYVEWMASLKSNTAATYRYGLERLCEFTGKLPTDLINEAREDYINRVPPWEVRHVKYLEQFIVSLDKSIANQTKLLLIKSVRNFYTFYKIPILITTNHNIPSISTEEYLDTPLLKIEDIREAVRTTGTDKMLKALILTFLSSGQGQAEVQKLRGKHLKNIVGGVAIVNMTRGKTNTRYTFFIGPEALDAIKEYKPDLKDEGLVFTLRRKNKPLSDSYICGIFARHAEKIGVVRKYFAPHRFRHFFKTQLTGLVDSRFIEYWQGHKLPGVEANYFIGSGAPEIEKRMLEVYIKNLDKLTVFTSQEALQKQYDDLKKEKSSDMDALKQQITQMEMKWTELTKQLCS